MKTFSQFFREASMESYVTLSTLVGRGVSVDLKADKATQQSQLRKATQELERHLALAKRKAQGATTGEDYENAKEEVTWIEQTKDYVQIVLGKL